MRWLLIALFLSPTIAEAKRLHPEKQLERELEMYKKKVGELSEYCKHSNVAYAA